MITLASLGPCKIILQQYYRITTELLQVTMVTSVTTSHYRFCGKAPMFADVFHTCIFLMLGADSRCTSSLTLPPTDISKQPLLEYLYYKICTNMRLDIQSQWAAEVFFSFGLFKPFFHLHKKIWLYNNKLPRLIHEKLNQITNKDIS